MIKRLTGYLLGGAAITALVSSPSAAQTASQDQNDVNVLDVIVVKGVRGALQESLAIKRDNKEFVDALVAEDFAEFPDSNLGEALQRIPGVTVDRNDGGSRTNAVGEGSTINLRGLGPNFTRTEINGFTASNPGQDRGFGFNVLSSDLFAAAEVRKSLNASDNEGGLAGTVNLKTYRPFDFDERVFSLSARGTYNGLADEVSPAGTAIFVDQFAGGRFGIAAGVTFNRTDPEENIADVSNWDFLRDSLRGNFDLLSPQEQEAIEDVVIPRDPRIIVNTRDQERLNATLTLQARPVENFTITFDNIYAHVDHTGRQIRNDYPIEGFPATFVPADLVTDGDAFVSGTFPAESHFARIIDYDYDVQTELYQGIISAEWRASDRLAVSAGAGYSVAEEDFRRWNSFDIRSGPTDIFYEVVGDFTTFDVAVGDPQDPGAYTVLSRIRDRPDFDQDEELSARVDFVWTPGIRFIDSIEFGARWAEREKKFRSFDGRADLDGSLTDLAPFLTVFDFDVNGAPAEYPTSIIGVEDFVSLQDAADPDGFDVPEREEARYDVTEETIAGYALANFDFGRLSGNVGVRVVTTDQRSVGFQVAGGDLQPASFDNDYTFALPSLNAKWDITDDLVGRFAVYRSLTRPELTDIQPARNFDTFDGGNGTSGNPELDPFTATNIDVGLEWYFGEGALFSVSYFRKDLNGLIERVVEEETVTDNVTGESFTVNLSRPINGEDAKVNGVEIGLQTPFFFLPAPFDNAGFLANATFTDSEATFIDDTDIRSSSLPGLSDSSYNIILYYDASPVAVRLAYNWRSDHLLSVSGSGGNPVSRDDYGQLDFASSYDLNDRLSFTFDVLNLTNEQIRSFSFERTELAKGLIQTGRRYTFGLNYRF